MKKYKLSRFCQYESGVPVQGSPRHSPQWTLYPGGVTSTLLLDSSLAKSSVTNDRSEARVDPLAALFVQGQTGKYQAEVSRAT